MPNWPDDYIKNVIDDVKKYDGVRKVVKAGLIERCMVRHCSPTILHPNPDDEFSQENIGPNLGIVSDYIEIVKYNQALSLPIFKEPLIIQKMEPDGYQLLNGHHRWFATMRMGVKKVHVKIVNLVSAHDLSRMIQDTNNTKLVTFDFDEVLLSSDVNNQAELRDTLFSRKIKERLRAGAPEVIKAFQNQGYDVCVYSSSYMSEDDFTDFFSMYEININVVVNGLNEKRKNTDSSSNRIKELLRDKYTQIAHVDNESVVLSHHSIKDYDMYAITPDEKSWADGIIEILNKSL